MAAVRFSSSSILSPKSSTPISYAGVAKRKVAAFKAKLCLHVLRDGQEPCTEVPKGAVVGIKDVECTSKEFASELQKIELAKAAMKPTMDKYGISPQDTRASLNADSSVHLEADVCGVLDVLALKHDELKQELRDVKQQLSNVTQGQQRQQVLLDQFELMRRERSLSIVSSSINSFVNRVLLTPLRISDDQKIAYFRSLRSDATVRARATELLANSRIGISVDQLLRFRKVICLPRNQIQHGIANPANFVTALADVENLVDGDRTLLTNIHGFVFDHPDADEDE